MTQRILILGSDGQLGNGMRRVASQYPDKEFIFGRFTDCNLTNFEQTQKFISDTSPHAIFHFAAIAGGIQFSSTHHATMLRDNTLMTFSVLEAARKAGVKKVILTLSAGMYPEDAPLPLSEDSIHQGPPHSSNYGYSFAKRLIEPAIRAYKQEYNLTCIGLVSNGIFGKGVAFSEAKGTMLSSLISRFYDARLNSDPIVVWGDGSPLREYTYSEDLAKIFIWTSDNYDSTEIMNVGSTEEYSIKDTALLLCELLKINPSRLHFDLNKPAGIFRKNTSNSRFISLSNFQYTPFRKALEETVAWYCDYREQQKEVL